MRSDAIEFETLFSTIVDTLSSGLPWVRTQSRARLGMRKPAHVQVKTSGMNMDMACGSLVPLRTGLGPRECVRTHTAP